jgi:glycosyltransferase involved in cell wall biosynthesis/uncharacterized membrane protein YbhN (UPF0104 family)
MRLKFLAKTGMLMIASAGAITLLFLTVDTAEIGRSLSAFDAWHATVAAALIFSNQACALLRFRSVLSTHGHAPGTGPLLRSFAIGQLSNIFLLNIIGQSLSRAAVLSQAGVPFGTTVAATYAERGLAFATLVVLAGIAAAILLFGATIDFSDQSAPPLLIAIGIVLSAALTVASIGGLRSFAAYSRKAIAYAARLWSGLLLTLIAHLLMLGAYAILLSGLRPHAIDAPAIAALVMVLFAASLPISFGGWGLRELSAAHALALVGVPTAEAVAVGLAVGVISTLITIIPGAIAIPFHMSRRLAPAIPQQESARDDDTTRVAAIVCVLLASTLVFFQLRVPVASGELTANLADPIAMTGAGCAVYLAWQKRRWPDPAAMGVIALITLAIAIALLVGATSFGLNSWATMNRGIGWVVIASYFAIGTAAASLSGPVREQALACIAASGASVAALQISCLVLNWFNLLPPAFGFAIPIRGFATNANAFAIQMLVLLSVTYALRNQRLGGPRTNDALLGLAAAAIALTNSRAGAAMVAMFAILLLTVAPGDRSDRFSATFAIGAGFLGAIAAPRAVAFVLSLLAATGDQAQVPELRIRHDTSDSERWQTISDGLAIWFANPILGGGLGAYVQARSNAGLPFQVIHSVPAWLLAEFGLLGVLLVGGALLLLVLRARQMMSRPDEARWGFVGVAVICCVGMAYLVHDFFYQRMTWLVLGLAIATRLATRSVVDARTDVVHVISGLGVGGAESMLAALALARQAAGTQQHVVALTRGGEHACRLREAGVDVTELDFRNDRLPFVQILHLTRLVARKKPRILQSWMYHADIAATIALGLSGRWSSTALVWGIRCSDMDLSRYRPDLRIIVRASALLSWLPSAIIANSHAGARVHLSLGYRPNRMDVIENGIDVARFAPNVERRSAIRAQLGIPPNRLVAINVARVDPMKDHGLLLAAMAKLPDVTCILVGKGTDRLAVPSNVIALGLRHDVDSILPAADIVVSSSAFGEGFSNAIAEGMAAGLVPIATAVGDCAEIVGDTGMVVPPSDENALVGAFTALRKLDLAPRAEAARARIVARFSLTGTIARFDDVYATLRGGDRPRPCAA